MIKATKGHKVRRDTLIIFLINNIIGVVEAFSREGTFLVPVGNVSCT